MLKNFKLKNTNLFYSLQCLSGKKKSSGKRIFLSVLLISFLTYSLCPLSTLMVTTLFFCSLMLAILIRLYLIALMIVLNICFYCFFYIMFYRGEKTHTEDR